MDCSFNLPAPAGFRGLDPNLPIRVYHRRLPHWRQDGTTYFVTFRLADSIPQTHLAALKRWRQIWESENPEPRSETQWKSLARNITSQTEKWLDEGFGDCVLAQAELRGRLEDSLFKFQDHRYLLSCYVVMPNHVHCLIKPLHGFELEIILKSLKGYTARQINSRLGKSGNLWEAESYDRVIRDEEHLYRVVQYIGRNPLNAGLRNDQYSRWVHPDWIQAGWCFQ